MSTLSPLASSIALHTQTVAAMASTWSFIMKKFVDYSVGTFIEKFRRVENRLSKCGRDRLEKLNLKSADKKLVRYLFGPKFPNEPLLSNPKVRQLLAGCLATAVGDAWGEAVVMEPGRFIFLTFIDERWVTGDASINLDMSRAINKVRCQLRDFRVSHISAVDLQAYDNMRAPPPNKGRWLEPHIHSIIYMHDDSPLLGKTDKEIEAALSSRYRSPLVHPEFGKLPRSVVAKLIIPKVEEIAYVAGYMVKRPDIKVARYTANGRPFNYAIKKTRSLQTTRILEALSLWKFNDMIFSGGLGAPIWTAAKREFMEHFRSRSKGTLDLSLARIDKFWRRVRKADPKLGDCRPEV